MEVQERERLGMAFRFILRAFRIYFAFCLGGFLPFSLFFPFPSFILKVPV